MRTRPVLAVELLSPANTKPAVEKKGVKEVWLIHLKQRTLVRVTQNKRAAMKGFISLSLPLPGKITLAEIL